MFDFIIRNFVIQRAQRFIEKLDPKVHIHIPNELPLPSVGVIKRTARIVSKINGLEKEIEKLSDEALRAKTLEFKNRIYEETKEFLNKVQRLENEILQAEAAQQKEELEASLSEARKQLQKRREAILKIILPEAFAVVREASRRVTGMRHFDVQLAGGIVLHEGQIAEMATGEGKTLVATLPAYLNALVGEGVHVVTVNDYLARRDKEWMSPIYEFLGLSVGVIQHDMMPDARQEAYNCDITYGTNNEFGFDYLRDNMVIVREEMVQRGHYFAIVDEVDSILIDEARTPLIISGPAEESTDKYYKANVVARQLKGRRITEKDEVEAKFKGEDIYKGYDYIADEKHKSVALSEEGEEKAARLFGVPNLHEMETIEYRHHILQALKAKEFFHRDIDYVVRDGKVIIVDEFTGRMMPGRRWSDGLHQAVEAKEGIKIERENQTLATITFQNYFRMYTKLAGMTGTAYTEATEFKQIYKLDCVVMPTNRILRRTNYPDCIYKTKKEKFNAVVEEIAELHKIGRPILVGTISIEKSELLSSMLKQRGIPHQVLNAKYHEREAHIIAQAGRYKAVTIATNMAGRGTDILLGGNPEHLAKSLLAQKNSEEEGDKEQGKDEERYKQFLEEFRRQCAEEHEKVVSVGGLHVLGTERHESRRIDNQLRGRSGRQGDPGSSRFYVSLEDDLMRLFGSDRLMNIMNTLGLEEGQVIESRMVSRAIEMAQKRVENYNFEIRKQLLQYDDVMNKQREVIYKLRRSILEGENLKERIRESIEALCDTIVDQYLNSVGSEQHGDLEALQITLKTKFGLELPFSREELLEFSEEELRQHIRQGAMDLYHKKEEQITPPRMRQLERFLLLQTIDTKWKDHLYAMDQLKEGIGLRAFAQRDPLVEYQHEGFEMFQTMFDSIHFEVAEMIFKVELVENPQPVRGVFSDLPQEFVHNEFSSLDSEAAPPVSVTPPQRGLAVQSGQPASSEEGPRPYRKSGPRVGRNDPCPCGSGKKYKKCCGR